MFPSAGVNFGKEKDDLTRCEMCCVAIFSFSETLSGFALDCLFCAILVYVLIFQENINANLTFAITVAH